MKKAGVVALVAAVVAIAVIGIVVTFTSSNSEVLPAVKQALQQAGDTATNDTRTLAEGQDEDSKTQVKDVTNEQKETSSEQFTTQTFVLESNASKRIIFQTAADAESAKMQGKVTVQGPGVVTISVDREHCELCGPYYVWGDSSAAVRTASNGVINIPLKANAEETLVIKNNAGVNQTIGLDLQVVYQTKA